MSLKLKTKAPLQRAPLRLRCGRAGAQAEHAGVVAAMVRSEAMAAHGVMLGYVGLVEINFGHSNSAGGQ